MIGPPPLLLEAILSLDSGERDNGTASALWAPRMAENGGFVGCNVTGYRGRGGNVTWLERGIRSGRGG